MSTCNACANSTNPPGNRCRHVAPCFQIRVGQPFQYIGPGPRTFKVDYLKYGPQQPGQPRQYTVTYSFVNVAKWTCDCPDFIHRQSNTCCKHIQACIDYFMLPDGPKKHFILGHVHPQQ